jgi:hypothetical protein
VPNTFLCIVVAAIAVVLPQVCMSTEADASFSLLDAFPELAGGPSATKMTIAYRDAPDGALRKARLDQVALKDGLLRFTGAGFSVGFSVSARDRYIVLRLKAVEEPAVGRLMQLWCNIGRASPLTLTRLDYMSKPGHDGKSMHWPWIWSRDHSNPLAAFAIHAPRDDAAFDENLLQMWVHEGLPHPPGEWTVERARTWLADWQRRFSDQSCLVIGAKNRQELDTMTAWAAKIGMKRIYLHTDTWRGEYWPVKNSYLHVNRDVFPRGEKDLNDYTSALREKGLSFAVHSTCMSIARSDPDYVRNGLHPELSRWVRGTLAQDAGAGDTTLYFRPAPGSRYPTMVRHVWAAPNTMPSWFNLKLFLLGDELVEASSVEKTDEDVWVLKGCRRGAWGKSAAVHKAGAVFEGMTRSYGQAFVPDPESPLFAETIRRWAEFCTRNNVDHLECDALENHEDRPWGANKFSWLLSSFLTLPSTSNASTGSPLPFQIEYWFRSSRHVRDNHAVAGVAGGASLPLYLHSDVRMATGPYEILYKPGQMVGGGGRSFNVSYPWPMFGVTPDIIAQHGLVPEVQNVIRDWRAVLTDISPASRAQIRREYSKFLKPTGGFSNHPATDVLFRPQTKDGTHRLIPLRLVGRATGELKWCFGQEFGPIVPRQYLQSGSSLALSNGMHAQEPEFVIRVMGRLVEAQARLDGSRQEADDDEAIRDSYETGTGVNPIVPTGGAGVQRNDVRLSLMPAKAAITAALGQDVTVEGDALRIRASNKRTEAAYYVDGRPSWQKSLDMGDARGLACTVTGDGSGALLVITLEGRGGRRDYIVPIDFTGTRDIEIVSGEVSLGDPRWSWVHGVGRYDYGRIHRVQVGFGMVPANVDAQVTVKAIRPMREVVSGVQDLTIKIASSGELVVPGVVSSEHYLWYRGGERIGLYDLNWNKVKDMRVKKRDFIFPKGVLDVKLASASTQEPLWMEVQFFTKGELIDAK